jgi:hypothetical protein
MSEVHAHASETGQVNVYWKNRATAGTVQCAAVSVGDFDQLTQAISESRVFDLPDLIGTAVEDAEQAAMTVTSAQKSKTVKTDDLATVPPPFARIVTLADSVAAKLAWENLNEPKYGVIRPVPLRRVEPQYTEEARKARLQGSVILQVEVRPDGTITPDNITVVQGLGMGLDERPSRP